MNAKKNKCIGILVVAVGISILTAACGGGSGGSGGSDDEVRVGYVPKALDQEFWLTSKSGAEAADKGLDNASVIVDAGSTEAAIDEQIAVVEDMLTRGADALCVAPTAPDQLRPVLTRAANEVPVLLVDTDIPDFDQKTSYIGTDNLKGGQIGGQFAAEQLGGSGKAAILEGAPGNTATDARDQGAEQAMTDGGLDIVASVSANSDRAQGVGVMADILQNTPDIGAVFAANDQMALGAQETLASRDLGDAVTLVGYDGTEEAAQAILDGEGIDATVAQNPYEMGKTCVEEAARAAAGEDVEAKINTGVTLVTKENAEEYIKEYRARLEGNAEATG